MNQSSIKSTFQSLDKNGHFNLIFLLTSSKNHNLILKLFLSSPPYLNLELRLLMMILLILDYEWLYQVISLMCHPYRWYQAFDHVLIKDSLLKLRSVRLEIKKSARDKNHKLISVFWDSMFIISKLKDDYSNYDFTAEYMWTQYQSRWNIGG